MNEAQLHAQRRRALAKGTEIRSRRAAVKAALAAGELDLGAIVDGEIALSDAAMTAEEIRLGHLLRSVPGIGEVTANLILDKLALRGDRPLAELSTAQRRRLARALAAENAGGTE